MTKADQQALVNSWADLIFYYAAEIDASDFAESLGVSIDDIQNAAAWLQEHYLTSSLVRKHFHKCKCFGSLFCWDDTPSGNSVWHVIHHSLEDLLSQNYLETPSVTPQVLDQSYCHICDGLNGTHSHTCIVGKRKEKH